MTETITVHHSGGRAGEGPLTWGQQAIWGAMQDLGPDHHQFNSPWSFGSPHGWTVEQARTALVRLFDCYESLRTRIVTGEDGVPRQVVDAAATVTVEIDDVATEADEAVGVSALRARLIPPPFDYAGEIAVRVGAVRRDGLLRRIVFVVSHHVADGESLGILARDFAAYADGATVDAVLTGRSIVQPLELAAHQATAEGRRDNDKSLRYWLHKLTALPTSMVPADFSGGEPSEPRFWQARLTSRELLLAANHLSAALQTSSTNVVLAAGATAIAELFGSSVCVLQVIANNRIAARYRHTVSTISMEGLFAVETGGSFADLVQRTRKASLSAYRFANYDKRELVRLVEKLTADKGAPIDRSCWFNDTRVEPSGDVLAPGALVERLTDPAARHAVTWPARYERQGDLTFSLHLIDVPDVMELAFTADTHVVSPGRIEQLLQRIQDIILDEAVRDAQVER
jgi:hypothetical protein